MDDELYQEMENELCRNLCAIAENLGIDSDSFDGDACQMACMIELAKAIREAALKLTRLQIMLSITGTMIYQRNFLMIPQPN